MTFFAVKNKFCANLVFYLYQRHVTDKLAHSRRRRHQTLFSCNRLPITPYLLCRDAPNWVVRINLTMTVRWGGQSVIQPVETGYILSFAMLAPIISGAYEASILDRIYPVSTILIFYDAITKTSRTSVETAIYRVCCNVSVNHGRMCMNSLF